MISLRWTLTKVDLLFHPNYIESLITWCQLKTQDKARLENFQCKKRRRETELQQTTALSWCKKKASEGLCKMKGKSKNECLGS